MKKLLMSLLIVMLLFLSIPVAASGDYSKDVEFVGQWTNESSTLKSTTRNFDSANDKLGAPDANSGLLRGLAKHFLYWSDREPTGNGEVPEGARLFSPEDKISDVFPNGIPDNAKIYGVYYSVNTPYTDPFPQDSFSLAALGGIAQNLRDKINDNKVMINASVKSDDILKGTDNHSDKRGKNVRKITDYYEASDDKEVVLKSEFKMNPLVSMLSYRNKHGSNQLRPILSYDYNTRYKNNNFITEFPKDSWGVPTDGYTYVDLNMDFGNDKGLIIPEKMFLEFKSYAWRPLYAFGIKDDETKELLNIYSINGDDKGKGSNSFKDLVSQDPITRFGVQTKARDTQYRKITIRVVLREWNNDVAQGVLPSADPFSGERIPEISITPEKGKTIAETIIGNMELNILGSADGIKSDNLVKISDTKAKELADGNGKDTINITGNIKGHVFASAGTLRYGRFSIPLSSNIAIDEKEASEVIALTYINKEVKKVYTYFVDENGNNIAPSIEGTVDKIDILDYEFVKTTTDNNNNTYHHYKKINIPKLDDNIVDDGPEIPTYPVIAIVPRNAEDNRVKEIHKAYIAGYEDKTVRANGNLTRAEAAAMVTRLAEVNLDDNSKPNYADIKEKAWYISYINAASKLKMIDADDENNLRPDDKITRAEFAKMLAAIDKDNGFVSKFEDIKGHKYEKEINKIAGNGRIEGYEDNSFKPDGLLTRAEACAFLNRMFNRISDDKAIEGFENSLIKFTDLNKSDWFYYEIIEATNTHELVRRDKSDKFNRVFEDWTNILNTNVK